MERSPLIPSLYVGDLERTLAFYREVLDFELSGSWEEDGRRVWAEVRRPAPQGEVRLWFFVHGIASRPGPALSGVLYLFLGDVDELAARVTSRATVVWGPETQPYGLRELAIEDPDGYLLCLAHEAVA